MKRHFGKTISTLLSVFALSVVSSGEALVTTNVFETWESQAVQNPFTGTGDVTWTGDLSGYQITTANWPTGPAFAGSRSLRSNAAVAVTNTVITAFAFNPSRPTTWSVFVSGNIGDGTGFTSGRGFDVVLVSDSSNISSLEAGTINGYRLRLAGNTTNTIDNLILQKATGSGWSTINQTPVGIGANVTQGWNLEIFRESNGTWTYGFANGAIGTPVPRDSAVVDTAVSSGSQAGMSWFSPATSANIFGFDNFLITSVPEMSPAMAISLSAVLLFASRRFRS